MGKKAYTIYLALGFEFAGLIVAFIYLGRWVDQKYNLAGLGIAGGALLGMVIWIIHLVFAMRSLEKDDEK